MRARGDRFPRGTVIGVYITPAERGKQALG